MLLTATMKEMSGEETSHTHFWLKTLSPSSKGDQIEEEKRFDCLFVRLVGSGSEAVVLTEQPPKFLRSHLSQDGQLCFTSSAPQHAGRQWAFVLDEKAKEGSLSTTNRPAWAPVLIKEGHGDAGFSFANSKTTLNSEHDSILTYNRTDFHGFVVCDWVYGHPQLFWLTEAFKGHLPEFMQRVNFIKSPYAPSS